MSGDGLAWGKLNRDCPHQQHPLIDHMLDVAHCCMALLHGPGIHRALCQSGGLKKIDEVLKQRLGALAFLHDLGKANAGFQGKRWPAGQRPPGWPGAHGHVAEAFDVFQSEALSAALPIEALSSWGSDAAITQLLCASISHHGRPARPAPSGTDPAIWRDIPGCVNSPQGYSPRQTLATIGARLKHCFPLAFSDGGPPLPDAPAFAHLFAGLVQLADWLGSDTRFFPFSEPGEDRLARASERAAEAVHTLGLDAEWQARLRQHPLSFPEAFGVPEPRPLQAVMGQAHLGPLLILEAETGSGKTEAALWRFLHLAQARQVDALYFALPTRVAATQLYQRLCECVARLWPDEAQRPVVVRALSGYTNADGADMVRLPGFEVHWSDEPADGVAHRRWVAESPKRFLAAPIAVGTIDQALLGGLQVRHAHLRHAMLSRSLLVVDEVHASDAYMTRLLTHLLQAHLRAGGQALLLSATLGSVARSQFQALATPGTQKRPTIPDVQSACALPYPALSDGPQWLPLAGTGHGKTVRWQLLDAIDAPERIAALALEAARQGARVLVVRNTVPAAVATFRAVEAAGGDDVLLAVAGQRTLHHSRFSPADRPLLDAAVQDQLGKLRPPQPSGRIVIGTQTLEQSLDLDADLLITDLCPMDVLLQRLGRLHRHARPASERPAAFQQAQAWILTPAGNTLESCLSRPRHGLGRFHQGGGVYADVRVLEATRQLIAAQPERQIPQDNRYLVEMATHPQQLETIAQAGGAAWLKHGTQIEGELSAQDAIAKLHGLPFGQMFDPDLSFPAQDEQRITTRLGAGDWLLNFEPPVPGPFGQPLARLNIRPHLLPTGLAEGETAQQVQALPEGCVEFLAGGARWRYDRMGLQKLKS